MNATIRNTLRWRRARSRALARDGHRCTVSRLLGGICSPGPLHVHHIVPLEEGGAPFELDNLGTACASHHRQWESLRYELVRRAHDDRQLSKATCPHRHRTIEGRLMCEARRARRLLAA